MSGIVKNLATNLAKVYVNFRLQLYVNKIFLFFIFNTCTKNIYFRFDIMGYCVEIDKDFFLNLE
jgi:hypothetical protein